MKQIQKIAVIGGGGRTGQYIINQLLPKGFQLKLLLRNPETFTIQHPMLEIIKGDVLDPNVVRDLVEDCEAVISTVGQRENEPLVASAATQNILTAIAAARQPVRYIALAGLNVDTPFDKKGKDTQTATMWMQSNFPQIHEDRQKSYAILAQSEADWILVRVPFIVFSDEKQEISVSLEDSPGSKITAASIAAFMIDQLECDEYLRKAPFIANR